MAMDNGLIIPSRGTALEQWGDPGGSYERFLAIAVQPGSGGHQVNPVPYLTARGDGKAAGNQGQFVVCRTGKKSL